MKWMALLVPIILTGADWSSQPKGYNPDLRVNEASPSDIAANEKAFYDSIPGNSDSEVEMEVY